MPRKPTNVSLEATLVEEAKELGVNLSQSAEAGVREAVRSAKAEQWKQENAEAIQGYNKWIEENGLPLAKYRMF